MHKTTILCQFGLFCHQLTTISPSILSHFLWELYQQEAYDPYYDDDSTHTGDNDLSYDTDDDGDDNDNDGHPAPVPCTNDYGIAVAPDPPILDNDPALFGPSVPPIAGNDDQHSLMDSYHKPMEAPDDLRSTGVVDNEVDEYTVEKDDIDIDDADESTGVEDGVNSEINDNTGVGEDVAPTLEVDMDDESLADDDTHPTTESSKFQQAVADRITRAYDGNDQRPPRRHVNKAKDPVFEYLNSMFEDMEPQMVFTMLMEHVSSEMLSFLTEQMSAKWGLKQFGTAGAEAIMKELKQIVYRKVMEGRKSGELTTTQK